jgi:hypothetical protein
MLPALIEAIRDKAKGDVDDEEVYLGGGGARGRKASGGSKRKNDAIGDSREYDVEGFNVKTSGNISSSMSYLEAATRTSVKRTPHAPIVPILPNAPVMPPRYITRSSPTHPAYVNSFSSGTSNSNNNSILTTTSANSVVKPTSAAVRRRKKLIDNDVSPTLKIRGKNNHSTYNGKISTLVVLYLPQNLP